MGGLGKDRRREPAQFGFAQRAPGIEAGGLGVDAHGSVS